MMTGWSVFSGDTSMFYHSHRGDHRCKRSHGSNQPEVNSRLVCDAGAYLENLVLRVRLCNVLRIGL